MKLKKLFSICALALVGVFVLFSATSCMEGNETDIDRQNQVASEMADTQQTPTDIEYSLERYNLIRRAYWVNGQREKAISLPCPITKPLGYVYLISMGTVIAQFTVDGKVTSLAKYLTPDYQIVKVNGNPAQKEMADVDGCYGNEVDGVFFFTTDGMYVQWSGEYIYTDIPFNVPNTVLQ